jgi:hypothetical protein
VLPSDSIVLSGNDRRWLVKVGEDATHCGVIEVDISTGNTPMLHIGIYVCMYVCIGKILTVERHGLGALEPAPYVQSLVDYVAARVAKFQGFQLYPPEAKLSRYLHAYHTIPYYNHDHC